eukprot:5940268-Pleurochrysis_carterae.AAC.5
MQLARPHRRRGRQACARWGACLHACASKLASPATCVAPKVYHVCMEHWHEKEATLQMVPAKRDAVSLYFLFTTAQMIDSVNYRPHCSSTGSVQALTLSVVALCLSEACSLPNGRSRLDTAAGSPSPHVERLAAKEDAENVSAPTI